MSKDIGSSTGDSPARKTPRVAPSTTGQSFRRDNRLSHAGARSMNNRQQNNNNNTHVPTAPTRSYNPNMVDLLYDNSSPEMEGTHPSNSQIPQQSMLCGGILSGIGSVPPRAPPPPLFNSNNFALSMNNNDASPSSGDSEVEIIDNDVGTMSGALQNAMSKRLNRNESSKDPTTYSSSQLKAMQCAVYREKGELLDKVEGLEPGGTRSKMYNKLLDLFPAKRAGRKIDVVSMFVNVWPIIKHLLDPKLGRDGLGRNTREDLKGYISMMEDAELACAAESEANRSKTAGEYKSEPMPLGEAHNTFMGNGASKPPKDAINCAKCGHEFNHQPKVNKEHKKHNDKEEGTWKKQNKHLEDFTKGRRRDAPRDPSNQKELTKIPPPKLKHLVTVCMCGTLCNSLSVGGYDCPECDDGSCEVCRCPCRFVCRIE